MRTVVEQGMVCRHHSGKVYTVLHVARELRGAETSLVVVYMGANGIVWVRPQRDFHNKFKIIYDGNNTAHGENLDLPAHFDYQYFRYRRIVQRGTTFYQKARGPDGGRYYVDIPQSEYEQALADKERED